MFPIHDDTARIHGRPYLNYALIGVNAIIFVWEIFATGFFTDQEAVKRIFLTYGTVPSVVFYGGDPLQAGLSIITSMFMHGGPAHIIGNMVFLFVFGDNIEDKFGRMKYLLIYLGWGFAAALIHSASAVSTGDANIPAVGASGAISGILGAYLVMFPRAKIFTVIMAFFITTVRIPALAYIPFWFILQLIFAIIDIGGGVAYLAHIGGFVAGAGTGLVVKYFLGGPIRLPAMKNPVVRKTRPRIEDAVPLAAPEVIEGPDYYEVIAEIRGIRGASDIQAAYDADKRQLKITAAGSRDYNLLAKLPESAVSAKVQYIQYLNGIARIRLSK